MFGINMNPTGSDITTNTLTIAVMGRSGVGKTNIVNQYMYQSFTERHEVSVRKSHFRVIRAHGLNVDLEILDTPGGYCFNYVQQEAMTLANVFVLVYSVDDGLSFQRVGELNEEIVARRGYGTRLLVVRNKTDLPQKSWFGKCGSVHETVTTEWGCPHFKVSAKDDSDMSAIFEEAVKVFYKKSNSQKKLKNEQHGYGCVIGRMVAYTRSPNEFVLNVISLRM